MGFIPAAAALHAGTQKPAYPAGGVPQQPWVKQTDPELTPQSAVLLQGTKLPQFGDTHAEPSTVSTQ